jgi:16S rRNA (guanine966-N2)-methyltransferase
MPSIRILGGVHKQRTIQSPEHPSLRPTAHRVRQTAFDILVHRFYKERIGAQQPFSGLRVLDVCAGLGGYGFEALSRGADYVSFVEQVPALAKQLSAIARSWNVLDRVRVFNHSWPLALGPGHLPYDVIFLDPPYDQDDAALLTMIQGCTPWLLPSGLIVVESNRMMSELLPEQGYFVCVFTRSVGQKHLSFLQKRISDADMPAPEDSQNSGTMHADGSDDLGDWEESGTMHAEQDPAV